MLSAILLAVSPKGEQTSRSPPLILAQPFSTAFRSSWGFACSFKLLGMCCSMRSGSFWQLGKQRRGSAGSIRHSYTEPGTYVSSALELIHSCQGARSPTLYISRLVSRGMVDSMRHTAYLSLMHTTQHVKDIDKKLSPDAMHASRNPTQLAHVNIALWSRCNPVKHSLSVCPGMSSSCALLLLFAAAAATAAVTAGPAAAP